MRSARRVIRFCVGLVIVAGCASTNVTQRDYRVTGKIPRPNHILVYDFSASPADVPPESALAGQWDAQRAPTADQLAAGRALGAEVVRNRVADINEMGLSAVKRFEQQGWID